MGNKISIIKADGAEEVFDREKLRASLHRSGANAAISDKIISHIEKELVNGMTTEDIYRHAFGILSHEKKPVAARYSLRRSLAALGPSGFPFEHFVAELFKKRGYMTAVGSIVQGSCAPHEIDVAAWNESDLIFIEAKFHNEYTIKSDLKVALYVKARFDDLRQGTFSFDGNRRFTDGLLITNTKFTSAAIQYAECTKTKLIGWNYPAKGNLQDLIEEANLHPITCLTTLRHEEKRELMVKGHVLCSSVRDNHVLSELHLDQGRKEEIIEESKMLCPAP